jgi:hypothetical protein
MTACSALESARCRKYMTSANGLMQCSLPVRHGSAGDVGVSIQHRPQTYAGSTTHSAVDLICFDCSDVLLA